jgi:PAS domain S-box-containing protein
MLSGRSALDDPNDLATRPRKPHKLRFRTILEATRPRTEAGTGTLQPAQGSIGMSRHLLMLIMAVAVPLALAWAGSLWMQYRTERARAEVQLVEQARAVAGLVDREFEEALAVAHTLASSSTLQRGDLAAFGQELIIARNMLSEGLPTGAQSSAASLVDGQGVRLIDSESPGGQADRLPATAVAKAAIASGTSQVSNLFIDNGSGLPRIAVAVPVSTADPGREGHAQVIGAVSVALSRDRLLAVVAAPRLPPGALASIQDRKGVTVARSVRDAETFGKLPMQAVLEAIMGDATGLAPPGTKTLEGVPSTIAFAHAPKSGFIVKLDIPEWVFLGPLWWSLLSSAAMGLAVLAGGLVLAFMLARRTMIALNRVIPVAEAAVANGGRLEPTGLQEADRLATALAANLEAREESVASLRQALVTKRALFDNSPVGVVVADTSGRLHEANDAFLAIVGRTRAEFEENGLDWHALTPTALLPQYEAAIAETAARGKSVPFQKEYIRPDGTRVPVLLSFGLIDEAAGLGAAFVIDLSERQAAAAALRESEERLQLALQGVLAIAFTWEVQLDRVIQHHCSIAGLLPGKTGQQRFADIVANVHPDDRAAFETNVQATLQTGSSYRNGFRVVLSDGSLRWLEEWGTLVRDDQGRPQRLVGVAMDVTDRKQAELALADSEARLRDLLKTLNFGTFVTTGVDDGIIRFWSKGCERLYGWMAAEALGQPMFDLLRSACPLGTEREAFVAVLKRDGAWAGDVRHRARDGREVTVSLHAMLRRDLDGRPREILGMLTDVTAQRAAEAALAESEARLSLALKGAQIAVYEIDFVRGVTRVDTAFAQLADSPVPPGVWLPLDDDIRREAQARFHPEDAPLRQACMDRLSRGDDSEAELDFRMFRRDGSLMWLHQQFIITERDPVTGAARRLLGLTRDVTQSRDMQAVLERLVDERTRELRETQARLAHTERLQALGQLAGGIAHDINNVLQAVQGGSALLERRCNDPSAVRRLANLILDAAERGAAVTSRLLAFSRRADLQAEPIDVALLLQSMKDMLAHTLGTGIDVRILAPKDLPTLVADKAQLETALINLATNARDAMNGMGILTLAAADEVLRHATRFGRHLFLEPGRYIHLSVTDTGCGMDAATLGRVTEPFFTTKAHGKGTGLGLAMAKGFSEQSGGGIHIESAPGRGTIVHLYFPASAGAASLPSQDKETLHASMEGGNVRVLLVDDDAMVRDVVQAQMEEAGLIVSACASGCEALACIDQGDSVDVLISDLSMPVMDGLTLIREAKRRRPNLPAILLTGFSTNVADIPVDGEFDEPFLLLRKPISGEAIVRQIASFLEAPDVKRAANMPT